MELKLIELLNLKKREMELFQSQPVDFIEKQIKQINVQKLQL